jgi:hypothetical protein
MEKSESITELAKALNGFQADMGTVPKTSVNPFYKSKYADLESFITAAKPHLKTHGLSFSQFPTMEGLITILMHESGEYISSEAKIVMKDQTAQGQGSAITYMRRYALSAVLGIATEDDDDGNHASQPAKPAAATKAPTKTPARPAKPLSEEDKKKVKIADLMKKCKYPVNRDNAGKTVFALTKIQLLPENYDAIIENLTKKVDDIA